MMDQQVMIAFKYKHKNAWDISEYGIKEFVTGFFN